MSHVYAFGPFRLDPQNESLRRGSQQIHLTSKAFAVLRLLIERAGQLVTKAEILAAVWPDGFIEPANLTQTIYLLRKALDDHGGNVIETVPGRGYRVPAAVESVPQTSALPLQAASSSGKALTHIAWVAALLLAVGAIGGSDFTATHHPPTGDPRMQRDYVLGRHYWNERTIAGINAGLRYFKEALAIDPHSALVHSGLADSYSALAYYLPWSAQRQNRLQMARAEALKAIALDPEAAEGHASLAFVDEFLGPSFRPEVRREFQRSLALDDRYATAHEWYSWFLFRWGDQKGALREMARARDLDPLSPVINFALGNQLYYTRHYKEASEQWQLAIAILPTSIQGYYGAGLSDEQMGDERRAEQELLRALTIAPNDPDLLGALAHVYVQAGQTQKALALLNRLSAMRPAPAYEIAVIKTALGQQLAALQWLAVAKHQHDENMAEFDIDPRMDKLRHKIMRYMADNAS